LNKQIKSSILIGAISIALSGCGGDSIRTTDNNSNTKKSLKIDADNYVVVAQHFQQKQARHLKKKKARGYKETRSFPGKNRRDNINKKDSFLLSTSEPFDGKFKQFTVKYNNNKTITQINEEKDSVRVSYFVDDIKKSETTMSIQEFNDLAGEK